MVLGSCQKILDEISLKSTKLDQKCHEVLLSDTTWQMALKPSEDVVCPALLVISIEPFRVQRYLRCHIK